MESGIQADELNNEGNLFVNNFFRYGISHHVELETNVDLLGLDEAENEVGNIQVGGRLRLIEQASGYVPQLAFQTLFQITDATGEAADKLKMASILSSSHDLGNYGALSMNLNFGNYDSNNIEYTGFVISWGKTLFERWTPFIEVYTAENNEITQYFWDTGFAYRIKDNLLFDLSLGTDLESNLKSQFVAIGLSWRTVGL